MENERCVLSKTGVGDENTFSLKEKRVILS